jgi:hypothetical protein
MSKVAPKHLCGHADHMQANNYCAYQLACSSVYTLVLPVANNNKKTQNIGGNRTLQKLFATQK